MNKMNAIMKKTYISPETLMVHLAPTKVLMFSNPNANVDTSDPGKAPGDFETKGISDVNVWDNEW